MQGLVLLLLHLYVHLRKHNDERVKGVKLLLITATKQGRSVEAMEEMLCAEHIQAKCITVTPSCDNKAYVKRPYHLEYLWNVAKMLGEWDDATIPERACLAAESAARYLLQRKCETIQARFLLPGEAEIRDVVTAMAAHRHRFKKESKVYFLDANVSPDSQRRCLQELKEQNFRLGGVPIFVFCTTGIREDGWTIYVNVLIDSGLRVRVDHRSFLHIVPAMDRQLKQSAGRIARVHDGIVCVLTAGDPDSSREELTFGDQLQAYLGAASLGIPWPLETMRWTMAPEVPCILRRMGFLAHHQKAICVQLAPLHSTFV